MSQKLMEYFNKQPRLGCLSTSNKEGKVNVAYFGSPRMIDEKTITMGLGKNRTFACKFRSTSNTCSEKPRTPIPMISEHLFRKTSNTFSIFSELLLTQKKII